MAYVMRTLVPVMRAELSKAPASKTITLGIRILKHRFREDTSIQTIAPTKFYYDSSKINTIKYIRIIRYFPI